MPLTHGTTVTSICDVCGKEFRQAGSLAGRVVTCSEPCKVERRLRKVKARRALVPTDLPDRTPPSAVGHSSKRVISNCFVCGASFRIAPTFVGRTVTCSRACSTIKRSWERSPYRTESIGVVVVPPRTCLECGESFTPKVSKMRFCSNQCRLVALNKLPRAVKPMSERSRGSTPKGYVRVSVPNRGKMLEHRLMMELHLGRRLDRREVVHHKNGNRSDNRIDNLELFPTHRDHLGHHNAERLRKSAP